MINDVSNSERWALPTSLPVVVGVDGSQHSKRALAWAVDYAQLSGAPLRIICAWEIHGTFGGEVSFDDVDFQQEAEERLAAVVAELVPNTMATESRAVEGHPSNVLTQESGHARLLVLGSRGRGGFANLLLGSITDYCSHHAKCPVVVVRGDNPEPPSAGC